MLTFRRSPLVFALALVISAAAAVSAPSLCAPAPSRDLGPYNLTIFHTNDTHGAFLPEPARSAPGREQRAGGGMPEPGDIEAPALVGGIVALAQHLASERASAGAYIVLDAGDFMTGNPVCDIADGPDDDVAGGLWQDLRNLIGYDVGVVGNHEFDRGRESVRRLAARATFPLLAADILDETGRPEFRDEPVILERGGLRVGVMGVSCRELFAVTADTRTAGLSLRDQAVVVREQIARLDPQTDLLVLISHSGLDDDKRLAARLKGSGLDVIVGGHSHTRLAEPLLVDGILIVQAGSHLKYLGRLDLRVEDDRVVGYSGRLIELTTELADASRGTAVAGAATGAPGFATGVANPTPAAPIDPRLVELTAIAERRVSDEYGRVIGTLAVDWKRGEGESNIGDWIADRLRERASAEVAFINSGGIRKNLAAGPIRLLDIKGILPFENTLVTFELTGAELRKLVQRNAENIAYDRGAVQVSGLSFGFRRLGDHVEVEDLRVAGRPVENARTYKAAAADYVCMKSEQYFGLPVPQTSATGVSVYEAIVEAVQAAGTVEARIDGRMRDLSASGGSR